VTAIDAAGDAGRPGLREQIGAWAFRHRSWIPVPLALVLIGVRWHGLRLAWLFVLGLAIVAGGLTIRFWGVSHIGTVSRTRARRWGPLITSGPFTLLRNPLYIGNFLIWTGFAVSSGLVWMLPIAWAVFAVQYGAIARWEEAALIEHFGDEYRAYARVVPRWTPDFGRIGEALRVRGVHGWREVAFSERGTLIAAGVMALLLLAKYRYFS
jgi:protein-S-isoprenylcysteine O-methyltransferase Ste14